MIKDAARTLVCGASGSGKTTRVKALLQGQTRVVAFDPLDEYRRAGRWSHCETMKAVKDAMIRGWGRGFKIAYVPPAGAEPLALHQLSAFLTMAQRPYFEGRDARQITFIVEEMNLSFPVASLPSNLNGFPNICSRGRHSGINVLGVTQRLAEINTRFRGNTTSAYFFRQGDHTDAATAARMVGPQYRSALLALPDHEYLHFAAGQVTRGRNSLRGKRP